MMWIDNKKVYDMVLQTWIIDCLNTYKISNKVIKFITEAMKDSKVELTAGVKTLAKVKIQWGIFQGNALLPLLLVITMITHNHLHKKCTGSKFTELQEKINHFMYRDIKLFAKNGKDPIINYNKNIQSGHRNGIWHRRMSHTHKEKWKKGNNWRNRITESRIRILGKKENYKYVGIMEADIIKQVKMKKKKKKRVPQINKKASGNQGLQQKSHQQNQHLSSLLRKILLTILKIDK